jgi:hypothetical protein
MLRPRFHLTRSETWLEYADEATELNDLTRYVHVPRGRVSEKDLTLTVATTVQDPFFSFRSTTQPLALLPEESVQLSVTFVPETEPLSTGAGSGFTVIVFVVDAVAPALSVTRNSTVKVPGVL